MISVCPPRLTSGPQPAHDARPHPHRVFMQQRLDAGAPCQPDAGPRVAGARRHLLLDAGGAGAVRAVLERALGTDSPWHRLSGALLHESSLARTMPQDAAHDLPDEVPEARQKQPESGSTQLVNAHLTPNKRPISDGAARAHVRQRCCTNRSSCNNAPRKAHVRPHRGDPPVSVPPPTRDSRGPSRPARHLATVARVPVSPCIAPP